MGNEITTTQANPAALLQIAVEQNADLDKLERLMDLQDRWEKKEASKAFADSLANFQAALGPIIKSQVVDYTTSKGRTTFAFANIDTIAQQIRPLLDKNDLSYRFSQVQEGQNVTVTCTVTHKMGHSEEASLSALHDTTGGKNAIQAMASTVTYLRRYTLTAVLGITTGDHDDNGGKPEISVDELLDYMNVVREEFPSIAAIKEALATESYSDAKEAFFEIDENIRNVLWRAPTKGGIFTTEERTKIRSNEFHHA